MATEEDLFQAVKDGLQKSGTVKKMKAELRAEVMKMLGAPPQFKEKPEMPADVALVNELIREYLDWMGYYYTSSIFSSESGIPEISETRRSLLEKLHSKESKNVANMPLLCGIISTFKQEGNLK